MTTDPLRKQVVEAMAQAMGSTFVEKMGWGESKPFAALEVYGIARHQAEAALDAALDVLGDQAIGGYLTLPEITITDVDKLVAVLRAGKGSDE